MEIISGLRSGEPMDRYGQKPPKPILVTTKTWRLDFAIGLALIGQQGCEQLAYYIRKRRERDKERERLGDAS